MKRKAKLSLKQSNLRILSNKDIKKLVGGDRVPLPLPDCPREMEREEMLLC